MTITGDQIAYLKETIAPLEAQRAVLSDAVNESALACMRKELAELQSQPELPQQQCKLASILFTDIVGSIPLGQILDPGDDLIFRDVALRGLSVPVEKHAGNVTRYLGIGFKAVFGEPAVYANGPKQAVQVGCV
jgi:class 3 adenylate cyclase